jgi:GNAT-like C-terminal domain/N-acyltransferase N-terminal domain
MSFPTTPQQVPPDLGTRLGMRPGANERLACLPPAAPVELPDDAAARELMEFCSVPAEDQTAMLAARPDPARDPGWWWLLRGTVAELRGRMGQTLSAGGYAAWPTAPEGAGPVGMFLYAWSLLTVVPDVLALHRRRGIPESVSRDILLDLGGVMTSHREVTGRPGVGLFPLWGPPQSFSGINYTLGRHTFTRAEIALGDGLAGYALLVHIPPYGPLREAESRQSIDRAIAFFARHFPGQPVAALVCKSWTLDPQLAGYLSPDANLIRFQRRFQLLPRVPGDDESEGDREMMRLGLQLIPPGEGALTARDLDRVPRATTLQRAFADHIRAGRHWHARTGIIWLAGHAGGAHPVPAISSPHE